MFQVEPKICGSTSHLLDWRVNSKYDLKSRGCPVFSSWDLRLQRDFLCCVHTGVKVFPSLLFIPSLHDTGEGSGVTAESTFREFN